MGKTQIADAGIPGEHLPLAQCVDCDRRQWNLADAATGLRLPDFDEAELEVDVAPAELAEFMHAQAAEEEDEHHSPPAETVVASTLRAPAALIEFSSGVEEAHELVVAQPCL